MLSVALRSQQRRAGRNHVGLIVTAKMNEVDPQAWLRTFSPVLLSNSVQKLDELLPWNWGAAAPGKLNKRRERN